MTQRDPVVALRQMLDFAETLVVETEGRTNQEILDSAVLWNASIHSSRTLVRQPRVWTRTFATAPWTFRGEA